MTCSNETSSVTCKLYSLTQDFNDKITVDYGDGSSTQINSAGKILLLKIYSIFLISTFE